ncbi:MAG: RNA polymerase sigma factor [Candidatus Kapaibacterium sp.]
MRKKYEEYSDSELFGMLTKDKQTAEQAFKEIYSRHAPRVYAYCRRFMGNNEEAQDVFQETFAKFFECASDDREMTNTPGFLLRIARNLCVNLKKKERSTISFEDYMAVNRDSGREQDELLDLIKMALELLQPEYREMFILREYEGFSYSEITDITNEPLSTVKIRIYRAKQKIREILQPYLAELSKHG